MSVIKLLFLSTFLFMVIICNAQEIKDISGVPAWAKEAVWYQIFPERFYNGDTANDPKPIDMLGSWPYYTPEGWQIHPWTSDWYKLQPWEVKEGKNFYDVVNIRRYGGDLQGVIDKLDYLRELGVTAIYLNPIFESPSLHKYDATMFHHIDNNFGPDPVGDRIIWNEEDPGDPFSWKWTKADALFLKLVNEVHRWGMKIIIDGVFNHTGTTFWAFRDVVKNQQNSKYKDWFIIKKWDDPATKENEFEYAGWYGVKDLPEINEDANGLVSGPREHIKDIVKRWMDPNNDGDPRDGIDGWRLDVAEMVNHNFWRDFRKWVREINPDAYTVGEVWWQDWSNYKMFNAGPWLGDQFDAVMNYRFTRALKNFVVDTKDQISPQGFVDSLTILMNEYGENFSVMMNLLGSHDTERLASMIVNPDIWYDHSGNARDNQTYDVRKPTEEEIMKQKLMVGIQFTLPGAPQIYNGDEAGMWGGDDPDCRKPNVWPEFNYEAESVQPFGKPRPVDEVKFDQSLFEWYKKLADIRNANKTLSLGKIDFYFVDNENKTLGYKRFDDKNEFYIFINNNSAGRKVQVHFNQKSLTDLITGKKIKMGKDINLKPFQIMILH
ncbi:MAG: glycoside hydrolase family 13 protein [bacterium]